MPYTTEEEFRKWLEELDLKANVGAFSTLDAYVLVPDVMNIPKYGIYMEVGVDRGKSLSIARMAADKDVMVGGVDLREDPKVPNTVFYQGDSVAVAKDWPYEKIDVLFIDGDHSYEGCKRDIEAWYPHMKKGGIMLFHDCDETSPGVVYAVFEFFHKVKSKGIYLYKHIGNTSMARIEL